MCSGLPAREHVFGKQEEGYVSVGYTNWKDATGEKSGGFPTHERSEVSH